MEGQGFVLGTMLARRSPAEAARLAGGDDAAWRGALNALLAEPRAVRAAALAELIGGLAGAAARLAGPRAPRVAAGPFDA